MKTKSLAPWGYAWVASGLRGFFGEGYWFHSILHFLGLCFAGTTFVTKTFTIEERLNPANKKGNMRLKPDGITPEALLPDCIYTNWWMWLKGHMLNAVGLSNMGTKRAFMTGELQKRRGPFMVSFMPTGATFEERWVQIQEFRDLFRIFLGQCRTLVAIQLNISCPNTGHDISAMASEVTKFLDILKELGAPIVIKVNALFPIELAKQISLHPACGALSPSNTIGVGDAKDEIDWNRVIGSSDPKESPLSKRGYPAGGLSGPAIFWPMIRWIKEARKAGIECHINAGGGIRNPWRVFLAFCAGADSVSFGTVFNRYPWWSLPSTLTAKILGPIFYCLRG